LHVTHRSLKIYLKWANTKVERHHAFMQSRREWIRQHNEGGATRVRDRSALEAVQTVQAEEVGGRTWKKGYFFVEKAVYEKELLLDR
jgi:hypothetical protein